MEYPFLFDCPTWHHDSGAYLESVVLHKAIQWRGEGGCISLFLQIEAEFFKVGVLRICSSGFVMMDENQSTSFDSNYGTNSNSSSSSSSSNSNSNSSSWNNLSEAHDGPLFDMAALAASLPRKRGLSSFYGGKSQSFSCLADVKCVEDLGKPEDSYYGKKKLKGFQSCGSKLNMNSYGSIISKRSHKPSRKVVTKTALNFAMSCRPPVSPTKHVS